MFYDRFIELCDQKGVSPSRAALEAGISKSLVTKWKQNQSKEPSPEVIRKLAEYFGISRYAVVEGQKEKPTLVSENGPSDNDLIRLWASLSPDEILRVKDFVQGMIANRKESPSDPD